MAMPVHQQNRVRQVTANIDFPAVLRKLFEPYRYKILYGGRGASKSWGIARALLVMGTQKQMRILCAREVMKTIDQSVYQLLLDQIDLLGYGEDGCQFYSHVKNEIRGINGTIITFTGLRAMTAANIKSHEGVDICWVEEGQAVSHTSWKVLIPTIRKLGSEIWTSFNPDLDTDDTYVRFVVNTPPNSWLCYMIWSDNPWFTESTMPAEREHSLATESAEDYSHTWEGKPRRVLPGAIYATEVTSMIDARRYRPVPYDPNLLVHTIWDLGWNDQTSIIFAQVLRSSVSIINYMEGSFLTLAMWKKRLDNQPYAYGSHRLPWDGGTTSRQTGLSDRRKLMKLGLRNVHAAKQVAGAAELRITASREMFPRVYLDNTPATIDKADNVSVGCGRLMECLKRYVRNIPHTTEEPATPKHDQFSHGADAWGELGKVVHKLTNDAPPPVVTEGEWEQSMPGVM